MPLCIQRNVIIQEYFRRLSLTSSGPEVILQCTGFWENLSMRVPSAARADPSLEADVVQRERFMRGFQAYYSSPPGPVAIDPSNLQVSSQEDVTIAVLMVLGPKDGE